MKNKFCVYYLLLCLTLGSVFCPQKAYADGEILALKPSSLEVNLGDNLEIIIHISNASNLASLATDITYNPELLQFNPDLSTYVGIFNDPTAFSLPIEEMVSGNGDIMLYADIFESVMSGGDAINGDVDLAILSFTAINTGIDNLEFSGLFITDDMSTELIPLSQEGAAVTIIAPYVPDVISPVITLNGSSTIDLIVGEEYVEYGANAIDDIDGDISSNIIVTGIVSTSTVGSYSVRYNVADAVGNVAEEVVRIVNVNPAPDTTAPVLSNGSPSGALSSGTTQATLSLTTDEPATCKYANTAGIALADMVSTISGVATTTHSSIVNGLVNSTSYNYYVRYQDINGNANLEDYLISFSVASAASSGSGGGSSAGGSGGGGGGGSSSGSSSSSSNNITVATSSIALVNTATTTETVVVKGVESADRVDDYADIKSLAGVAGIIVEAVSGNEAGEVYSRDGRVELDSTTLALYNKIVKQSKTELDQNTKYAVAYFIHFGTKTTKILGAGERAGVLNSYFSVYGKLPVSVDDWKDVIKIANGRWPSVKNEQAEKNTQEKLFKKIYVRTAQMTNANDNAAVSVITYGLRPANRNMNSEANAIKIFKGIFKYNPTSAVDWDIVRAIAYSGAKR